MSTPSTEDSPSIDSGPSRRDAASLNWTGYVYGRLAHSSHLQYDDRFEAVGERSVRRGLTRMGLAAEDLKGRRVMDVGTGGYALGFSRLGARVDHRDISSHTVRVLNTYAASRGYSDLRSVRTDLVTDELPPDTYDLIYLSGIFQHFSDPARALVNVSRALKTGGYLYVDIYRSGRWRWFVVDMLRSIASHDILYDVLGRFSELCALGNTSSFHLRQVELMVDDLFVDHVHLFQPRDLEQAAAPLGLERVRPVTSMDRHDPATAVDHSLFMAHVFNTLVFGKAGRGDASVDRSVSVGRNQLAELEGLGGTYRAVADITADFIMAHRAGRFSKAQTASHLVNLFRMAHPCFSDDPYLVPGQREGDEATTTKGDAATLEHRHALWCAFLANVLGVPSPLPSPQLPSFGYELVRFIQESAS
jgi:SAM-dependent methyltransferase